MTVITMSRTELSRLRVMIDLADVYVVRSFETAGLRI